MIYVPLDTIVKSVLLRRGYPMHWYLQFLKYACDIVRELSIRTIKKIDSDVFTVGADATITVPANYVALVRIGEQRGQYIKPLVLGKGTFMRPASSYNTPETKALALLEVVSNAGYIATINVADPVLGTTISLGTLTASGNNTNATTICDALFAALTANTYGYVIARVNNTVQIQPPVGYGAQINGGGRLSITNQTIPGVDARVTLNISGISYVLGRELSFFAAAVSTTIGTYTMQSGDNVPSVLTGRIVAALAANGTGYVVTQEPGDTSSLRCVAPAGTGARDNGFGFFVTWAGGSTSSNFASGVNGIASPFGINIAQFAGGVTAITKISDDFSDEGDGWIPISGWLTNDFGELTGGLFGFGAGVETDTFEEFAELGKIRFHSSMIGSKVVMDYLSDPNGATNTTRVSPLAQACVEQYVIWQMKEHSRVYPKGEAKDEERMYWNEERHLRARMQPLSEDDILRISRRNYRRSNKS